MIFMKNALSVMVLLAMFFCVSICFGAEPAAGSASNPIVVIETTAGDITVELYKDKAPKSVENFLAYMKSGYYSGTIFHRVIKGFMIQGGGLTEALTPRSGLRAPIENEATNGLKNEVGTLAMARTNEVNSATSQFFINTANNTSLNNRGTTADAYGYAVFGKVTGGMNVVFKIEKSATGDVGSYQNVPKETITIKSVHLKAE
jgi:cyclophilin family peptidyl-prolyl cis-trans isomerase